MTSSGPAPSALPSARLSPSDWHPLRAMNEDKGEAKKTKDSKTKGNLNLRLGF